ncbi:MAG TPA: VWA domain-containing protein [Pyrinomonadaceae bacterium]|nr:VWA domain-containing protein [Pyrinomonadaceae bacterium]
MTRFIAAVLLSASALCVSVTAQKTDDTTAPPPTRTALSYGLVVDNSGSFRLLLDKVIAVVEDVIEAQGPDDEAFLVTFVDTPKIVLRQEFTSKKSELHDAAQNMFIEGGQTKILDAVKSAADYFEQNANKEPGRMRSLVLVTDGDDRESKTKIDDLLTLLKERSIRVFVVAMSDARMNTKIVGRLAKETGGSVYLPKNKAELTTAAKDVSAAMRSK